MHYANAAMCAWLSDDTLFNADANAPLMLGRYAPLMLGRYAPLLRALCLSAICYNASPQRSMLY